MAVFNIIQFLKFHCGDFHEIKVLIFEGGLMGAGIAQTAAQAGYNVTLVDVNDDVLLKSQTMIDKSIKRVAKAKFKEDEAAANDFYLSTVAKIKTTTDRGSGLDNCDIAIEAIIENMDIKKELFKFLDQNIKEGALLASNTSSLSISEIAKATSKPDRVGGLHFFNPVPVMKLVEVVRGEKTSDVALAQLKQFGTSLGKNVVTCKDTPGFIVNRLLVPYLNEAVAMIENGVATPEDIDTAMKLGAGYPMGPIELADYVGLDTTYFILKGWSEQYPDEPAFTPRETVKKLVSEGKLGRKSGEGFYKY
eukprot:TRINITY_DN1055_c0_g1_i1.p1 TRINITY_DN1055_c0_g1~~TRINITY_DN1055_c0_g1_i1.p1  ORF type:complete len:306 (+),score=74.67 TRINITY_DN1055_c0_g1_i1:126-1043(+)